MEQNVFLALAKAMWARGEDGEELARMLALAFAEVVKEGTVKTPEEELTRFIREAQEG